MSGEILSSSVWTFIISPTESIFGLVLLKRMLGMISGVTYVPLYRSDPQGPLGITPSEKTFPAPFTLTGSPTRVPVA